MPAFWTFALRAIRRSGVSRRWTIYSTRSITVASESGRYFGLNPMKRFKRYVPQRVRPRSDTCSTGPLNFPCLRSWLRHRSLRDANVAGCCLPDLPGFFGPIVTGDNGTLEPLAGDHRRGAPVAFNVRPQPDLRDSRVE